MIVLLPVYVYDGYLITGNECFMFNRSYMYVVFWFGVCKDNYVITRCCISNVWTLYNKVLWCITASAICKGPLKSCFHCSLPRSSKLGQLTAVADSGAQTCASGPAILEQLGIEWSHLVPTSHHIQGVTQSNLNIWGVLMAKITAANVSTNQVIYICDNALGLYLSKPALQDLGCFSPSLPKNSTSWCSTLSSTQKECSCQDPFQHQNCPAKYLLHLLKQTWRSQRNGYSNITNQVPLILVNTNLYHRWQPTQSLSTSSQMSALVLTIALSQSHITGKEK